MSLFLGENKIADNTCSRNIGEIVASTIPLSDAGLHLLDGALINGAGSYAKFVNHIAGLVTDYPDLFVSESDWQQSVTTYGVCGKFVYDSVNNTVRLPKITGFTEGTIDPTVLGDLTQAGLPNITGACSLGAIAGTSWSLIGRDYSGAFQPFSSANQASYGQGIKDGSQTSGLKINASASNSIYGNSSTVQPQSIKVLYYIVIASSITNELNLDVADLERSKADVDLSNVNASGTSLASGWSMPSSRYIDLTLGASGSTYTAPANGYFRLIGINAQNSIRELILNNTTNSIYVNQSDAVGQGFYGGIFVPALKGNTVVVEYTGYTSYELRFIYAEGEN